MANSNVYFKHGGQKVVLHVVGFPISEVVGEELDYVTVYACFLEDISKKAMIEGWEELYNVKC